MKVLTIVSIILFLIGLCLELLDKIVSVDFRLRKEIGFALLGISLLLFIFSIIQSINSDRELNTLQKDHEELKSDYESLKIQYIQTGNIADTTSLPGISISLLLSIPNQKKSKEKYILDYGESISRNRISIYLDADDRLTFRIIDSSSNHYSAKIDNKKFTLRNKLCYILCEYGESGNSSFIRILINGETLAYNFANPKIDITHVLGLRNGVVGADLKRKHHSMFSSHELIIRIVTFTPEQIIEMSEYFNSKEKVAQIQFRRKDYMILDPQTNSLVQPKKRHKPYFQETTLE